ncbi:MAG TPA: hypothetical protein VF546_21200 [Pyrinomonadaceae bacterium]|jgi:hypothetical protein
MANVDLTIEGMIALFFERDAAGRIVGCKAGVLQDAPGHDFKVTVARFSPPPAANLSPTLIERDLRLVVTPPGITFTGGAVNRKTGQGAPQSFEWVLDLDTLYGFDIGARESGFRSILHLNGGEFFTIEKSVNKLIVYDESTDSCKNVGFVATKVGVRVSLPRGGTAEFRNGNGPMASVFTAGPQDRFEIEVLRVNQSIHGGAHGTQHHGDANFFYAALGHKIPPGKKKVFSSTPFPHPPVPVSPEASCLVPSASQTIILP